MEGRLSITDQSLNARVGEEGETEWQDQLTDDRLSPEDLVITVHDSLTRNEWIEQALLELSQREQTIIRARRLSDDSATLEELGETLGVSKERVRQLEQRALQKMKRSEEHTSELQSLMRISYAVFCLKTKKNTHAIAHPRTPNT